MRRIASAAALGLAALALAPGAGGTFPLGVSVTGGIGAGYYDMAELNRHIGLAAQDRHVAIETLTSAINFRVEGRLWLFSQVALTGGYEHLWGDTEAQGTDATLSYRAPSDVYTVGGIVAVLKIENVVDLCVGASRCFASSVYGTNEVVARRLTEYKGTDRGYEAYAEAHTNFLNPIEVGFQLGYRGLAVETFKDKTGEVSFFEPGRKIQIDYSGAFFYLTTAIRL
jgi:hypothetical protein